MEFPLYGTILKSPLNCVSYTVSIRVSPDSPVAPLPRYTSKAWYSAGHTGGPLSRNGPWARHAEVLTVSCILLRNAATSPAFHQANLYTPFKAPAQVSSFQKPSFTFPERSHLSSFLLSTVPSTHPTGEQIIQSPHHALQACFPSALGLP